MKKFLLSYSTRDDSPNVVYAIIRIDEENALNKTKMDIYNDLPNVHFLDGKRLLWVSVRQLEADSPELAMGYIEYSYALDFI